METMHVENEFKSTNALIIKNYFLIKSKGNIKNILGLFKFLAML